MKKQRMYGLDILRVLSMLGIIGLHIVNQGGLLSASDSFLELSTVRTLAAFCYCSVNIFAMLTGYLYVERKRIYSSNLINLIFTVVFYCIVIFCAFLVFMPEVFTGLMTYVFALFPPIGDRYWYFVGYVLLFLMIPYLNILIHSLKDRQFQSLLLILFTLFSIVSTVGLNDYFKINDGYSPFWLIFCYLVGAYIKLHHSTLIERVSHKILLVVVMNVLIVVGAWFVVGNTVIKYFKILYYVSPLMVVNAAVLLLYFSKVTIHSNRCQRVILSLSNGAFGVFIIHSHILIFDYILKDAFVFVREKSIFVYIGAFFVGLLGIYLCCWFVDRVRNILFKCLHIKQLADKIGKKVDRILRWDFDDCSC